MKTKLQFVPSHELKLVLALLLVLLQGRLFAETPDTTFWYQKGTPDVWHYQPDVFAFRCVGGTEFTEPLNSAVVSSVTWRAERADKMIEVIFSPNSSALQRQNEITAIRQHPSFEVGFPVICRDPEIPASAQRWYVVDDILTIIFNDPEITTEMVDQFRNRNNLIAYSYPDPDLRKGAYSHVYMFKIPVELLKYQSPVETAQSIYLDNQGVVKEVSPNRVNLRIPKTTTLHRTGAVSRKTGQMTCPGQGFGFDPLFSEQYVVENQGDFSYTDLNNTVVSTADADADICECWQEGFTGNGVKIGLLGFGEYDYTHPDLQDALLPGWDCRFSPCVPINQHICPPSGESRGMQMAGIIAANHNNQGIAGIAKNTKVMPIVVDQGNLFVAEDAINRGLQKCIFYDMDISVFTHFDTNPSATTEYQIALAVASGRPHPNDPNTNLGMIVIAPAGNGFILPHNANTYPAAYPDVIGIISTTPNDVINMIFAPPEFY